MGRGLPGRTQMNDLIHPQLASASQLTGAEAMFLDVLEAMVRASAAASSGGELRAAEAHRLRQLFFTFRSEFRQRYLELLEEHLGTGGASATLEAFKTAPMQRYVAARRAMIPELTAGLRRLVQRMGATEI